MDLNLVLFRSNVFFIRMSKVALVIKIFLVSTANYYRCYSHIHVSVLKSVGYMDLFEIFTLRPIEEGILYALKTSRVCVI